MKLKQFCRLWKDYCVHRPEPHKDSDDRSDAVESVEYPDGFLVDPATISAYAGYSAKKPSSYQGEMNDERFGILKREERIKLYPNGLDRSALGITNEAAMQEAKDLVGAQTFTVWTLPTSLMGLPAQQRNQLGLWLEMQLIEKIMLAPFGNYLNSRVTAGVGAWDKIEFHQESQVRPIVYLTVCTKFLQLIKDGKATLTKTSMASDRLLQNVNDERELLITSGFDVDKIQCSDVFESIEDKFECRQVKIELSKKHSGGYSLSPSVGNAEEEED